MLRLINSGCNGHMGQVVTAICDADANVGIVAGVDINTRQMSDFPVYEKPSDIPAAIVGGEQKSVALVDFSSPAALKGLLEYGIFSNIPLVLCATGYNAEQQDAIEMASKKIAVFRSGNMSIGINLVVDLIKRAAAVLGEDFDVEIIERHHRRKVDAPSGTALMLANAAASSLPYDAKLVYERERVRKPRDSHEIGISAVRGGTIVGEHEVIFAGQNEIIELRHSAQSRDIFAAGAIKAAKYIVNQPPGLYSMEDVLR
ncbi:MAG: 4-hydroxy-tetrahydrodipicolinate reductase [Oscillospiraceae bacterium]|nr:4-hydroxy-tetrahydrodipicolinate reductase [Oscillospiraceae bacterium]